MANDATYNKFGRLIKIAGTGKWETYKNAKVNGNIVFAQMQDSSTDVSNYPAGNYIYANGVEYKVASLDEFRQLEYNFRDFAAAVDGSVKIIDSSVNELERWRNTLNFKLENNKITIVDGTNAGIKGEINLAGSEYVNVNTNASTMTISLDEADIQYGNTSTGDTRKLATKGYVDDNVEALNSSINASLNNINVSIRDISVRLDDASTRLANVIDLVELKSTTADNKTTITVKTTEERGTELTQDLTIIGDEHVKIATGTDTSVKVTLNVYNTSIDGLTVSNNSVYGAGSIKSYVDRKVANLTGAIRLIGNVDSSDGTGNSMYNILRGVDASKGNMWIANASFDYTEPSTGTTHEGTTVMVEIGDQVIITENATATKPADFMIVERNLDGAVTAGKNTFKAGHLIMGDADGKQTVVDSQYILGGNTSAGIKAADTDNRLATEKAVNEYVEKRIDDISVISVSNSSYLTTGAVVDRTEDKFTITTGVNVVEFKDAKDAVNSLADASTFWRAIDNVKGTMVIEKLADASANITLKMSGGDTSVRVNGGDYVIVERGGTDVSTLNLEVRTVELRNAVNDVDGLAVAANVSSVINDVERATAAAFAEVKKSVGLTENLGAQWSDTIKTNLGIAADSSVINTIEVLNASVTAEVNRLDASIIAMDLDNMEEANKVVIGIDQKNGIVSASTATLTVNGSTMQRAKGTNNFAVTIDGTHIKVGGATTQWKDSSIEAAVVDLSNMIQNISTNFLKTVTGDNDLVKTSSTTINSSFVAVATTKTANDVQLDTSILLANPVTLPTGVTSDIPTENGVATDKYVADYVVNTLAWECY